MGKALRMDSWEIVSGVVIPQTKQRQWLSFNCCVFFGTENTIIKQIANSYNKFEVFTPLRLRCLLFLSSPNKNQIVSYFW